MRPFETDLNSNKPTIDIDHENPPVSPDNVANPPICPNNNATPRICTNHNAYPDNNANPSLCSNCQSRIVLDQHRPWPRSEPNMLESFSRTMRSYIPNIPIPIPTTAAPSPPLVSRPVSFGSFMTSTGAPVQQQPHVQDTQAQPNLQQQPLPPQYQQHPHLHHLQQQHQGHQYQQHAYDGQVVVEDLQAMNAYQGGYYQAQPQFGGIPPPQSQPHPQQNLLPMGSASPAWGAGQARPIVPTTAGITTTTTAGTGMTAGQTAMSPTSPTLPSSASTRPVLPVGNVPDPILWSRWGTLTTAGGGGATSAAVTRRLLLIGYLTGIQVWDCTELKSVREVLNLDFVGLRGVARRAWGGDGVEPGVGDTGANGGDESGWDGVGKYPLYAGILPDPLDDAKAKTFGKKGKAKEDGESAEGEAGGRPYLGLIMYDEDHDDNRDSGVPRGHTNFVVYSLAMNRVVKSVELSRPQIGVRFEASDRFVVISTARPPMIHVLSATTFDSLFIIPSTALIPFAHKLGSSSTSAVTSTSASNPNDHANIGSTDKTNNNNNISRNYNKTTKNIVSLNQDLDATLQPYSSPIATATATPTAQYNQYSQPYPGALNQLHLVPISREDVYYYPTLHPLLLAQPYAEPIFAFSGRLLAFASVTPTSYLHHTQQHHPHPHPQQQQQQPHGHSSSRGATPISPTSAVSSPRLVAYRGGGTGSRPSSGMAMASAGSPGGAGIPGSYGSLVGIPGSYGSSYGYSASFGSNSSAGGSYGSGVVAGMTSGSAGSSVGGAGVPGSGIGGGGLGAGGSGFVGGLTNLTNAGLSGLSGLTGITGIGGIGGMGMGGTTQQQVQAASAELGNAALKVGGSMLSGVKTLGGFAFSVAKNTALGATGSVAIERGRAAREHTGAAGDGVSFFSKSAPTGGLAGGGSLGDEDEDDDGGKERKERRFSSLSATGGGGGGGGVWDRLGLGGGESTSSGSREGKSGEWYYVTVLDLGRKATSASTPAPSSSSSATRNPAPPAPSNTVNPTIVHEFRTMKTQPVSKLSFSDDGNSVIVAPRDGQSMLVFSVRPTSTPTGRDRWSGGLIGESVDERREGGSKPHTGSSSSGHDALSSQATRTTTSSSSSPVPTALPSHVYELKRGRTSGIVEGVDWARDGRWVAIGTRNRTVHVFAVNPYGGKADVPSHVEGRVRNVEVLQPRPVEVSPLVRLRPLKSPANDQPRVPLSFVFMNPTDAQLPPSLLPPSSPTSRGLADPPTSPTNATTRRNGRPTNYQDVLLFDPADGSLSLRRFILEAQSTKDGRSTLTNTVGASMSTIASALPGRLNTSSSTTRSRGRSPVGVSSSSSPRASESPARGGTGVGMGTAGGTSSSGLTRMMDAQAVQLVARDSIAATWNLQRRRDWKIVLWALADVNGGKGGVKGGGKVVVVERVGSGHARGHSRAQSHHAIHDWLAQAELSTCSRSPHILPRTIYLIHRFTFRTLGEDYHALIRRYHFDLAGPKINVRKEIEISAHGTGTTESFIEGFSSSPSDRHTRRHSSAFDEPLANALAGALEYTPPPAVLPMLPNGAPNTKPFSIPTVPMPIRSVAGIDVNGVGESLGRIRRGVMHKVRSPPLLPRPDSANRDPYPISLEFDEEDEDFIYREDEDPNSLGVPSRSVGRRKEESVSLGPSRSTGVMTAASGSGLVSVSTAATSTNLLESVSRAGTGQSAIMAEDDEDWHGWDTEDKFVVEEVERFDNISAVGFLDEEQERVRTAAGSGGAQSSSKPRRSAKKHR